jgi:hypothetical protein
MPEHQYSEGGNNFFNSLACELKRVGLPLKSKVVMSTTLDRGKGTVLDIETASRQARTDVLMHATAMAAMYAKIRSPSRELAAAACVYNVEIICYNLAKGVVTRQVYLPKEGVVPRAQVVLGSDEDQFWSCLSSQTGAQPSGEILEIPVGSPMPKSSRFQQSVEIQQKGNADDRQAAAVDQDKVEGEGQKLKKNTPSALDQVLSKYGNVKRPWERFVDKDR